MWRVMGSVQGERRPGRSLGILLCLCVAVGVMAGGVQWGEDDAHAARTRSDRLRIRSPQTGVGYYPGWPRLHVDLTNAGGIKTLQIYYWAHASGGRFAVWQDGKRLRAHSTKSSTPGVKLLRLRLSAYARHVWLKPLGRSVRILGMAIEKRRGFVLDRMGVSGAELQHWLRIRSSLLKGMVRARKPDLWITMFGTNESHNRKLKRASYGQSLRKLFSLFKRGAPGSACLVLLPMDVGGHRWGKHFRARRKLRWLRKEQKKAAKSFGCATLDLARMMGGESGVWRWAQMKPRYAYRDMVHLSPRGYTLMARRIDAHLASVIKWPRRLRSQVPYSTLERRPRDFARQLRPFIRKVQRHLKLGRGFSRVFFLGDSHVSIGQLTNILRRQWQSRLGNGGPGWLQPSSMRAPVTPVGGAWFFWTGSWYFSSTLRPKERSPSLMGLGGRVFFTKSRSRLSRYKRYQLLYPGIHGISKVLLRRRSALLLDQAGASLFEMRRWGKRGAKWRLPMWVRGRSLWREGKQVFIGCKRYYRSCTLQLQGRRLSRPVMSSPSPVVERRWGRKGWVRYGRGHRSFKLCIPQAGSCTSKRLSMHSKIRDVVPYGKKLWILTAAKPHLTVFDSTTGQRSMAIRKMISKPWRMARVGRFMVATQKSGYYARPYDTRRGRGLSWIRLRVRGPLVASSPGAKELFFFGHSRHVQVLRSDWNKELLLSMPGKVRAMMRAPRGRKMWLVTHRPDALWRMRLR